MSDLVLSDRAALALLDEAERALGGVETVEAADELWRKVRAIEEAARLARLSEVTVLGFRRVQLRAKRRYGELLGPANRGRPTGNVPPRNLNGADRKTDHRARALAFDVPDAIFEAHLEQDDLDRLSEAGVLREARRAARPEPEPVRPAEGTYSVLLADPPWRYEQPGGQTPDMRAVENHYPSMSVEDICELAVPSADDAVLFLWGTNPLLREALSVMDAWGFDYRTNACWVKDRMGMGYYVRGQHELLLIGRRGKLPVPDPANRPASVIAAPRQEHSRKPDEVYTLIERMYPELTKVELFARRPRDGWAAWGNQLAAAA